MTKISRTKPLVSVAASAIVALIAFGPHGVEAAEIRSWHSAMCIDAWDGAIEWRVVVAASCHLGAPNQQFVMEDSSARRGASHLRIGEKWCMVPGTGGLALRQCVFDEPQRKTEPQSTAVWRRVGQMGNVLTLWADNKRCLDMSLSEGSAEKRPLVMWNCNGQSNQAWMFSITNTQY